MRAKNVVGHLHLRARVKLVWSRITLSRLTTAYFVITAIHCIIQIGLQSHAFSINASAADGLWSLLVQANQTGEAGGFAVLSQDDLRVCYSLPDRTNQCLLVWSDGQDAISVPAQDASSTSGLPVAQAAITSSPSVSPTIPAPTPAFISNPALISSPGFVTFSTPTISQSLPDRRPTITDSFIPTPVNVKGSIADSVEDADDLDHDHDSVPATGEESSDGFSDIVQHLEDARGKQKRAVLVFENSAENTFTVTGLPTGGSVDLSKTCVKTLIWPVQRLDNTKREDITLIAFQIWVMGMSVVALLNESIPHIFAALVTQFLVAVWTIQQIFETESFRDDFVRLTVNGACPGHNLLGPYWSNRKNAEIASSVLNVVDVFLIAFFTYKLVKIYSWQTYKRIGASLTINRVYKLVLCLSVAIQLALFFIVVAASLWLDQLYHGSAGPLSEHRTVYIIFLILIACLLVPWLTLGWFAIRREMRKACLVFLVLNVAFIIIWAALYGSNSFRWTFTLWSFFAVMSVAAGILIICTLGLGLACRLNFGKGLPQYLNFQEPVDGVDFAPVLLDGESEKTRDLEKVDFPSFNGPSPTFSAFNQFGGLRVPDKAVYPSQQREGSNTSLTSNRLVRTDTSMSDTSQSSTDSNRKMDKRMVIE